MTHVVCIGDVHLVPTAAGADRRAAVEFIIDKELSHPRGVTLWVILGDLNHGLSHGRLQPDDRNWWAWQCRRMGTVAPVVILYGNHDIPGDLDVFRYLASAHPIYVVDRPLVIDAKDEQGNPIVRIFALPYPHKAGQVAAGASLDDAREALHLLCRDAAGRLAQPGVRHTLVVGHVNIAGAISSVGQPQIGQEIELDASALAVFSDRTPKVFGHIHKAQEMGGGAWYAGSVCPMDWGETEPKSYITVDYPDHPQGTIAVRREEIPAPRLWHVEGTVERLAPSADEDGARPHVEWVYVWGVEGETPMPDTLTAQDRVRVRYQFPASARDLFSADLVRAPFEGAGQIKLEPIAVPDRTTRAPQVTQARTLDEKVLAWAEHARRTLTDEGRAGVAAALHTLQAQDRETVIGAVVARLKAQVEEVAR